MNKKTLIQAIFLGALHLNLSVANAELGLFAAMAEVDASHPLVRAKREELSSAESGQSAAKQQRLPTLSVQTSKSNTTNSNTIATTRLQQPLFAGGRIDAGIERAEALIAESQASLALTRRDLMIRTASTFIEIVKSEARLKIADKNISEHERLLESISRRVSAEISPESDLALTKSRLSQAITERAQIALSLMRAEDALAELLNRRPPRPTLPPKRSVTFPALQSMLDMSASTAPEILRASAQEILAASDLDIQKSAAWPSVFLRHEQLSGNLDSGTSRSQTYVGLEFVPGAGFSVAAQIRAAESRRLAAIESRRAAEKDIRDRIRSLWAESQSLRQQLISTQSYVQTSTSVAESFARQFTIGRKTWLEVLNAIRESLLAELALTDQEWSSYLINLRLEAEIGLLSPDKLGIADFEQSK